MRSGKLPLSLVLGLLTWLLAGQSGWAFYNPSTGRWLSRDPLDESGFGVLHRSNFHVRTQGARMGIEGAGLYAFIKNDGVQHFDASGLQMDGPEGWPSPVYPDFDDDEPDVTWGPPSCPKGQKDGYVQVAVGFVFNSDPHVDNGRLANPFGHSTGCPLYPTAASSSSVFQDTPGGLIGKVYFTVCHVCLENCTACKGQGKNWKSPWPGFKIVSKGACVSWWSGDKGDLSDPVFVHSDAPPPSWDAGMNADFPKEAQGACFRCFP